MQREDIGARDRPPGVRAALAGLFGLLTPRRRRHLYLSMLLMVIGAIAELVAIGAVLPFLAILAAPEAAGTSGAARTVVTLLGLPAGEAALLPAVLLLVGAAVAAAAIRIALTWSTQAFVFRFGHEIGVRIYSRLLRRPYLYHVQHNSSEALAAVEKVQQAVVGVLLPVMQGVVAAFLGLFIIAMLIAISPGAALISAAVVLALYAGLSLVTRKGLGGISATVNQAQTSRLKLVQEGLGGIRDILLDRSQPVFERSFADLDDRLRRAQMKVTFIAAMPRVVLESCGIILIALLALYMSRQPGGLIAALPLLGAFAIGAQRLLPLVQVIYLALCRTTAAGHTIAELVRLAHAPAGCETALPTSAPKLKNGIELRAVRFRYPGASVLALSDIDLAITAGEKVGIIGPTGGGKSTLLDLVMGLLDPSEGRILIDGTPLDDASRPAWQSRIAHVPQSIYLADASIAENIAFGISPELVDPVRIHAAAVQAQIAEFIAGLPDTYRTRVGERGFRLSGGQRQRLGIARALYKQPSVLILDEATSALDDETEAAVIAALDEGGEARTVLMVAHRLTTLAACDRLIRLRGGRIVAEGSYEALVGGKANRASAAGGGDG